MNLNVAPGARHGGQPEAGGVHPAQPAVGARALAAGGGRARGRGAARAAALARHCHGGRHTLIVTNVYL